MAGNGSRHCCGNEHDSRPPSNGDCSRRSTAPLLTLETSCLLSRRWPPTEAALRCPRCSPRSERSSSCESSPSIARAYQLKEADPHTWAIPRLDGRAKAALVDIQIGEYGDGNAQHVHATLFVDAMRALELDPSYGMYLDRIPGVTLATVNLVSLLGLHRRWRGALVGHLALFEMCSVVPMGRYAHAMHRLGAGNGSALLRRARRRRRASRDCCAARDGRSARSRRARARERHRRRRPRAWVRRERLRRPFDGRVEKRTQFLARTYKLTPCGVWHSPTSSRCTPAWTNRSTSSRNTCNASQNPSTRCSSSMGPQLVSSKPTVSASDLSFEYSSPKPEHSTGRSATSSPARSRRATNASLLRMTTFATSPGSSNACVPCSTMPKLFDLRTTSHPARGTRGSTPHGHCSTASPAATGPARSGCGARHSSAAADIRVTCCSRTSSWCGRFKRSVVASTLHSMCSSPDVLRPPSISVVNRYARRTTNSRDRHASPRRCSSLPPRLLHSRPGATALSPWGSSPASAWPSAVVAAPVAGPCFRSLLRSSRQSG